MRPRPPTSAQLRSIGIDPLATEPADTDTVATESAMSDTDDGSVATEPCMSDSDTYSVGTETAVLDADIESVARGPAVKAAAASVERAKTSSDPVSSGTVVPGAARNAAESSSLVTKRSEELMALRTTDRPSRRSSTKTAGPQGVDTPVTQQTYVTVLLSRRLTN